MPQFHYPKQSQQINFFNLKKYVTHNWHYPTSPDQFLTYLLDQKILNILTRPNKSFLTKSDSSKHNNKHWHFPTFPGLSELILTIPTFTDFTWPVGLFKMMLVRKYSVKINQKQLIPTSMPWSSGYLINLEKCCQTPLTTYSIIFKWWKIVLLSHIFSFLLLIKDFHFRDFSPSVFDCFTTKLKIKKYLIFSLCHRNHFYNWTIQKLVILKWRYIGRRIK